VSPFANLLNVDKSLFLMIMLIKFVHVCNYVSKKARKTKEKLDGELKKKLPHEVVHKR
jgi:hypothetical protein